MPERHQPTRAEIAQQYGLHGQPPSVSQLAAPHQGGGLVTAYAQWQQDEARIREGQQRLLVQVAQQAPAPEDAHA